MKKAFILLVIFIAMSVYAATSRIDIDKNFYKENGAIYLTKCYDDCKEKTGTKIDIIKDVSTFKRIGVYSGNLDHGDAAYYKDSKNVYREIFYHPGDPLDLGFTILTGADKNTFKQLYDNEDIFVDKYSVYFGDSKIAGADAKTFGKNKYGNYVDKNNAYAKGYLYYEGSCHIGAITGADTSTFREIKHGRGDLGSIYKDKDHLFFYSLYSYFPQIVSDSNSDNLKIDVVAKTIYNHSLYIDNSNKYYYFIKDLNNVYYSYSDEYSTWIQSLTGVDSKTFVPIDINLVKDKNYLYYLGSLPEDFEVLKGIDLKTFKLYLSFESYDNLSYDMRGKIYRDKDAIYYSIDFGKPNKIPGVDSSTFKYLSGGYAKDKNNYYFFGDDAYKLEGVDASSFKVKSDNRAEDKNYYYEGVNKKSK